MSYIGRNIDSINNIATLDNLSFNGNDATFNLTKNGVAFTPISSSALNIQIDGVIQSNNYSVNNATVTFDFVPSASSVCNNIRHYGVGLLTTVSDGAITEAKIGSGAVTSSKIASGVIPTFRPNANSYIMNGNFDVWQRGTSFTTSVFTSDRWLQDLSGASATLTRETHTVGQTDVPDNPKYYLKQNVTTGNNNCGILQRIEDVDTLTGAFTLSFYAKGVNPNSGNLDIIIQQNFGSGGSTAVSLSAQDLTLTSSWQKFVFTGTLASLSGKTIGTSSYIQILIKQPDDDSNTAAWNLQISQVQLESGTYTSATIPPFQHESYGDNLARCQRYFEKSFEQGVTPTAGTQAPDGRVFASWDGASARTQIDFATTKRASPTVTIYRGSNTGSGTGTGTANFIYETSGAGSANWYNHPCTSNHADDAQVSLTGSTSNFTATGGYVAELNFTADSEL